VSETDAAQGAARTATKTYQSIGAGARTPQRSDAPSQPLMQTFQKP